MLTDEDLHKWALYEEQQRFPIKSTDKFRRWNFGVKRILLQDLHPDIQIGVLRRQQQALQQLKREREFEEALDKATALAELRYLRRISPGYYVWLNGQWFKSKYKRGLRKKTY